MSLIRTTLLLITVALVASCGTLKPAAKAQIINYQNAVEDENSKLQPIFLNVKAIEPQQITVSHRAETAPTTYSSELKVSKNASNYVSTTENNSTKNLNAENFSMLQLKYAIVLDVPAETIENITLFTSINEWYGTRYRFGGTTKKGIDCSSLMQHLYADTYGKAIPRTAVTQYKASKRISQEDLKEGDLIFFHTTRSGISHVGLYLGNRRFVHASSSRGVTINSLDEKYYVNAYRGCGRFEEDYVNTNQD